MIDGNLRENLHFKWSPHNSEILRIRDGDRVKLKIPDSSINQIHGNMKTEDLANIDSYLFDGAVGPIYVEGSKPGDSISVEIIDIKSGSSGWSAIIKDFGLLKNIFPEKLIMWKKIDDYWICTDHKFLSGIKIPDEPFLGVIGTSPGSGEYGMIPPQNFGGNMDNRMARKGSKIVLPVLKEGAMLSFGDPHGHQGDGEVCGTAIETSAEIEVRIGLLKEKYEMPVVIGQIQDSGRRVCASGIGNDLYGASRDAVLSMIHILEGKNLTPEESYILMSVAGNLSIREIVDEPNFVVNMCLDLSILERAGIYF